MVVLNDRWQNGECRFGDRCNFAHGETELRSLPPRDAPGPGAGRGRGRGRGGGYEGNSYRDDYRSAHHGDNGAPGSGVGPQGYPQELYARPSARDHAKWVASGCPIVGHGGWTQYQTDKGEKYYHNKNTDVTQWDPPAEWKGPV